MLTFIVRPPTEALGRCELTQLARQPIDTRAAATQHQDYGRKLADLGVRLIELSPEPAFPDAVFVEDVAVVLDELAVLTRPGAPARRAEVEFVVQALARFRPLARIEAPGTMDGGDVLGVGRTIFVGLSSRTNGAGFEQFVQAVQPAGYRVVGLRTQGCLHLRTACSYLGDDSFLINPAWLPVAERADHFAHGRIIDVHPAEAFAANALVVDRTVLLASAFPRTAELVARAGFDVQSLDIGELQKAEAGLTCLSLRFDAPA